MPHSKTSEPADGLPLDKKIDKQLLALKTLPYKSIRIRELIACSALIISLLTC